ncbi:MAG: glycerol-3-phosphate transporter permease, partial [Hyphomicrobiales bacterium]
MQKYAHFKGLTIPLLLLLPQLAITVVFFYWPASQAVWQSFLLQDAFGISTEFVWFENYRELFADPGYYKALVNTGIFSTFVAVLSLSLALLFAVMADRQIRGSEIYKTLLIWPYAV